jgi:hypothetical protein
MKSSILGQVNELENEYEFYMKDNHTLANKWSQFVDKIFGGKIILAPNNQT